MVFSILHFWMTLMWKGADVGQSEEKKESNGRRYKKRCTFRVGFLHQRKQIDPFCSAVFWILVDERKKSFFILNLVCQESKARYCLILFRVLKCVLGSSRGRTSFFIPFCWRSHELVSLNFNRLSIHEAN